MGITDFAQNELTNIIAIEIPYINKTLERNSFLGCIEAAHAVLDLFMPVTGMVTEINLDILKHPGLVNLNPYDTWIIKIWVSLEINKEPLLTAYEYQTLITNKSKQD